MKHPPSSQVTVSISRPLLSDKKISLFAAIYCFCVSKSVNMTDKNIPLLFVLWSILWFILWIFFFWLIFWFSFGGSCTCPWLWSSLFCIECSSLHRKSAFTNKRQILISRWTVIGAGYIKSALEILLKDKGIYLRNFLLLRVQRSQGCYKCYYGCHRRHGDQCFWYWRISSSSERNFRGRCERPCFQKFCC